MALICCEMLWDVSDRAYWAKTVVVTWVFFSLLFVFYWICVFILCFIKFLLVLDDGVCLLFNKKAYVFNNLILLLSLKFDYIRKNMQKYNIFWPRQGCPSEHRHFWKAAFVMMLSPCNATSYCFRDNHREIVFREAKILTSFPFGVWYVEAPRLRLQSIWTYMGYYAWPRCKISLRFSLLPTNP